MGMIEEIPVPSSSRVYQNVRQLTGMLSNLLRDAILDRITGNMIMQDAFAFSTFYKEADIARNSDAFHVFESDHYRREIFRQAEMLLRSDGYDCTIGIDDSGRYRKITYEATVVHPVRKMLRLAYPMIPVAMYFAGRYAYDYIMTRREEGILL